MSDSTTYNHGDITYPAISKQLTEITKLIKAVIKMTHACNNFWQLHANKCEKSWRLWTLPGTLD